MIFRPNFRFFRVTDITPGFLRDHGIRGLLLDVDNTLSTDKGQDPLPGLDEWLKSMRNGNVRLTIISNASAERLRPFAERTDLRFVSRAAKPFLPGYIRGARRLGLARREVAMVGDQLFTDILGANLAGMTSILVEPVMPESGKSFVLRRKWEKKILGKERGEI